MNRNSKKTGEALTREMGVAIGAIAVLKRIEVEFKIKVAKSDEEIAIDVAIALQLAPALQTKKVAAEVINGWVFLRGELQWSCQKNTAREIVSNVTGVRGITNHITVSGL